MLAAVLLAAGLLLQLIVLNRLHLPGGGVPDLMLVLVASLAIATGPVPGMVTGFAAGLCLDLAPPGSQLLGQYALVFCLVGWAAGRLSRPAGRSPLRALGFVAVVVVAGEALAAGLSLLLEPAQVTAADVRQVLPATLGYDLLLCPFVLYLAVLGGALAADGLGRSPMTASLVAQGRPAWHRTGRAGRRATGYSGTGHRGTAYPGAAYSGAGHRGAAYPGAAERGAGRRPYRPAQPRIGRAAARIGDGWLGGGPGLRHAAGAGHSAGLGRGTGLGHGAGLAHTARGPARRSFRLHPGNGVPGSASGLAHHRDRPAVPVNLRLATQRRGDGAIGNAVGGGQDQHWPGRHPGRLAGSSGRFRPHGGELGGSAARQHGLTRVGEGQPRDGSKINFAGHKRDGSVGGTLGTSWLSRPNRGRGSSARLRVGASRSAAMLLVGPGMAATVPSIRFGARSAPAVRRPAAAPRFRRRSSWLGRSALSSGHVGGGVLDQSTFRAVRRTRAGAPRLRLAGRGAGMLGGSGLSPLRRPPARLGKQPRFGYGRRSPLSYLTGRHIGGRWLASKRVGSRSGVWLISKRTGGAR